jgi:hypothetical protein
VSKCVVDPFSTFTVETGRIRVGIQKPQQDDRFAFPIFEAIQIVPLLANDPLYIALEADHLVEAAAEPIDVHSTGRKKEHPQALVFVVRVPGPRWLVAEDTNRPVAIEETAG